MYGFTLMEMLVVIGLLGLVIAMALPGYGSVVQKTRRKDAEHSLQLLRQAMEQYYAKKRTYRDAASNGDTGTPLYFSTKSPIEGTEHFYDLEITLAGELCFELKATPVEGSIQDHDPCGVLHLNHAGERGAENNEGYCWNGTLEYQHLNDGDCSIEPPG